MWFPNSGVDVARLRQHRRKTTSASTATTAEDARHNARADKMIEELEHGGSSMLDAMERSVDERLRSTQNELAKVTDFRKRALKLLQSKLGMYVVMFACLFVSVCLSVCLNTAFHVICLLQRNWQPATTKPVPIRFGPRSRTALHWTLPTLMRTLTRMKVMPTSQQLRQRQTNWYQVVMRRIVIRR
jgi:hypothetical protein